MMSTSALRRPLALLSVLAFAGLTIVTAAHAALSYVEGDKAEFLAAGPAGLKIEGKGSVLTLSDAGEELKLATPLKELKTGIDLRDDHLQKAINSAAHPMATLVVKRSNLQFPEDNKVVEGKASGQFTLNGTTKPVNFMYQAKRTGSDYHVQAKAQFDLTEFKLEQPCYLGVCVDKVIKIKVKFKLRDQ